MNEQSIEELEWLQKRLGRFTASKISDIIPNENGRNKSKGLKNIPGAMTYIRTKLGEKLTMETKEQIDFKQATWGKENEPLAVKEFEKVTGKKGTHYGVSNPEFFKYEDYAGFSPDWANEDEGAEFKCPYNTSNHIENLLMKSEYDLKTERWETYCQIQMGIFIRGWKCCSYGSFDPRMIEPKYRLKIIVIYPDEAWVTEFKSRLAEAIEILEEMEKELI
jgi:hypothetical protein